jgi:hypothetical protein
MKTCTYAPDNSYEVVIYFFPEKQARNVPTERKPFIELLLPTKCPDGT